MATATHSDPPAGTLIPETNIDFERELTQGYAAAYIRRQAQKLSRKIERACPEQACVDDLTQQLTLHLWERLPQFDPARGCFNAFVKLIVMQSARDILWHVRAQKRGRVPMLSLEAIVAARASSGSSPALGHSAYGARLGIAARSPYESSALASDVATLVEGLPRHLRRIAVLLGKISAVAIRRKLRLSRKKFDRAMGELRQRFTASDLHEYLRIEDTP